MFESHAINIIPRSLKVDCFFSVYIRIIVEADKPAISVCT